MQYSSKSVANVLLKLYLVIFLNCFYFVCSSEGSSFLKNRPRPASLLTVNQKERTEQGKIIYYKNITDNNTDFFKGKIVLALENGAGFLSIYAAQAGAKHVYGIDHSRFFDAALKKIKKEKLEDIITLINSKVSDAELPVDKVDIIISKWMGYSMLEDSMLDSVIFARDKWLKSGGQLLPNRAKLFIAAAEKIKNETGVLRANVSCYNTSNIISKESQIADFDLMKVTKEDTEFSSNFTLTFTREGIMSGFLIWFEVDFEQLPTLAIITTKPDLICTPWKQTLFPIKDELSVKAETPLEGTIDIFRHKKNAKHLFYKLKWNFLNEEWKNLYTIDK